MLVARLHGAADLRVHEEADPVAQAGETVVRVTSVGVCGSDLHWFGEGGIGDAQLTRPLVVGHEFAGVTLDGRRVAVDPAVPCEECPSCLRGYRNLCPHVRFAGHGQTDGGLREYMAWPSACLHPLPDSVSDLEGALLEPLGVAIHAFDLGHLPLGGTAGVVGCGPIGLMLIQLLQIAGASTVAAVEPLPHRAAKARELGASTDPHGDLDVVFEVAGTDQAVDTAFEMARPGGRVVLAGIPDEDRTVFRASTARRKGLTIAMARRMNDVYPRAIKLVAQGRVDLVSLVSGRFALRDAAKAFAEAQSRQGLKIVIEP
ncbi:zinc-dependent alcohol dehydrogenase [Herbidospora yilanensis]|uniref:zinc-dependent alcohol dehydrogenase n=1 Tax=Herbidospora yilanensis TaxID=354426 RepID=UPI0007844513|nr:alcohol dehydrogenase catalytic domain-containing protein [Herbidospora yilanensis]